MERHEVSFESGGLSCAGWLTRPDGAARPPVVVMAHGFSALGDFSPAFCERFAAAGLATLSFDYRHFGRSGGQPRQLLDISRQLEDLPGGDAARTDTRRPRPRAGRAVGAARSAAVTQSSTPPATSGSEPQSRSRRSSTVSRHYAR